jgi:hypothetical protein
MDKIDRNPCSQCRELTDVIRQGIVPAQSSVSGRYQVNPSNHDSLTLAASGPGGPEGASWLYRCRACDALWEVVAWTQYESGAVETQIKRIANLTTDDWLRTKQQSLPTDDRATVGSLAALLGIAASLIAAAIWCWRWSVRQ